MCHRLKVPITTIDVDIRKMLESLYGIMVKTEVIEPKSLLRYLNIELHKILFNYVWCARIIGINQDIMMLVVNEVYPFIGNDGKRYLYHDGNILGRYILDLKTGEYHNVGGYVEIC